MKISKSKKNTKSNFHSSKPFSNKSGEGGFGFFSSFKGTEELFFSPYPIQPKLSIGQPNDKFEKEADITAEKVVQKLDTPDSTSVVQNKCDDCKQEEKLQKIEDAEMTISKKPIFESDDRIYNQFIQGQGINEVNLNIETQLRNSKGSGQPLDKRTRQNMEQSFGVDFSGVKVHTDQNAIQMNQNLGAQAFTNGNDIYFNDGKYNPNNKKGKKLLAHELTHVVQQKQNSHTNIQLQESGPPTFSNLPRDQPKSGVRRFQLVNRGQFWYELRNGQLRRARGAYAFVATSNRGIWAVRLSQRIDAIGGHTEAAQGGRVVFAGEIHFRSGRNNRGRLLRWSNASGHYRPARQFAGNAGLPLERFEPIRFTGEGGTQLPVFQPETESSSSSTVSRKGNANPPSERSTGHRLGGGSTSTPSASRRTSRAISQRIARAHTPLIGETARSVRNWARIAGVVRGVGMLLQPLGVFTTVSDTLSFMHGPGLDPNLQAQLDQLEDGARALNNYCSEVRENISWLDTQARRSIRDEILSAAIRLDSDSMNSLTVSLQDLSNELNSAISDIEALYPREQAQRFRTHSRAASRASDLFLDAAPIASGYLMHSETLKYLSGRLNTIVTQFAQTADCYSQLREIRDFVSSQSSTASGSSDRIRMIRSIDRGRNAAATLIGEFGVTPRVGRQILINRGMAYMFGDGQNDVLIPPGTVDVNQVMSAFRDKLIKLGMDNGFASSLASEILSQHPLSD